MGRFIVQFVELGFELFLQYKPFVCFAVRAEEFFLRLVFNGDQSDIVGIEYVEDNKVRVALIGWDREASCLVAEDDAADGVDLEEDEMGTCIVGFLGDILHVAVVMLMGQDGGWVFLGRLALFPLEQRHPRCGWRGPHDQRDPVWIVPLVVFGPCGPSLIWGRQRCGV